jgi:hypothetical protein
VAYVDLGSRGPQLGVSDANYNINQAALGTGWDVIFDVADIASSLTNLEIYHIALDGPVGASVVVMRDGKVWDYVAQGWQNGWDPNQPLPVTSTQVGEIQFCWNTAFTSPPYTPSGGSNVQPSVTLWLRQPSQI